MKMVKVKEAAFVEVWKEKIGYYCQTSYAIEKCPHCNKEHTILPWRDHYDCDCGAKFNGCREQINLDSVKAL